MFADDRAHTAGEADGSRWLATGAGTVLLATGTGMALGGHVPDPLTVLLTLSSTVLVVLTVPWRRGHRQAGTSLHDDVDPELGVGNGRAALATVDRELARAETHGTAFSLAVAEFDHEMFAVTSPRRARRILGRLFRGVADDIRLGDRVCRVQAAEHDLMIVVLPDTGTKGARTFTERLRSHAQRHLAAEGIRVDGRLRTRTLAHPGDADQIVDLQRRLQVLDGVDALIRDVAVRPVRMPRQPPEMVATRGRGQ